jgi:hypothetical protein
MSGHRLGNDTFGHGVLNNHFSWWLRHTLDNPEFFKRGYIICHSAIVDVVLEDNKKLSDHIGTQYLKLKPTIKTL